MKKTLALIMAAALAGSSLAGCGGKADNSAPETKPAGSEADNRGSCTGRGNGRVPGHRYGRCTCYGKGND